MNAVQLAEKALKDALAQEKRDSRLRELKSLQEAYEGKCFGSDLFERSSAASTRGATYYEKIYLHEDEIYVQEHTIRLTHLDSFYKKSMKQISYSRNIHVRQLTGHNSYHADYNLYSDYSFFRKEISLETFKSLWEAAEEANIVIKNAFNGKGLRTEVITNGDSDHEREIEKCIKDTGIDLIDFKDYPEVHSCLEYRTLPMFDKRRWLPKVYAKSILEWQIQQIEKDCESEFITQKRYEHNQKEIKIIRKFIKENL